MPEIKELTPLLDFTYRIVITAEGDEVSPETLEEINQKLEIIMKSLKFTRMG